MQWTVEYRNEGAGTALAIQTQTEFSTTDSTPGRLIRGPFNYPPGYPHGLGQFGMVLKSGEPMSVACGKNFPSGQLDFTRKRLNAQVVIVYMDPFGGGPHHSSVCMSYEIVDRRFTGRLLGGGFHECTAPDANEVK
jgi:hypothetical protein